MSQMSNLLEHLAQPFCNWMIRYSKSMILHPSTTGFFTGRPVSPLTTFLFKFTSLCTFSFDRYTMSRMRVSYIKVWVTKLWGFTISLLSRKLCSASRYTDHEILFWDELHSMLVVNNVYCSAVQINIFIRKYLNVSRFVYLSRRGATAVVPTIF